ncbi:MAG: hypothetical protein JWQ29_1250 [Phenylobacterium sp.]|nr:hypothetical protein [Phenylobacterium sp.]
MPDASAQHRPPPSVRFHLPAPALRELVTSYYWIESAGPLNGQVHPEWVNIRFSIAGVWVTRMQGRSNPPRRSSIFGPTDRTATFETPDGGGFFGIGLTPLGSARLIGGDISRLANGVAELGDLLGPDGDEIARSLGRLPDDGAAAAFIDEILLACAARAPVADPMVLTVHRALVEGDLGDVAAFAGRVGVSERTLNRICRRVFGFAPKRLLRRQRFLRTLDRLRDRLDLPLSELLEDGYYDQAHFIREFRAFMDTTPSDYFNSPREVLRRAAVERQRVVGATVQGVHPAG